MEKYIPIDCDFYDELVLLAMHKTRVAFIPNTFGIKEGDFIRDLVTEPTKEEFAVMNSGIRIRLDAIANVSDNLVFLNASEDDFDEEE